VNELPFPWALWLPVMAPPRKTWINLIHPLCTTKSWKKSYWQLTSNTNILQNILITNVISLPKMNVNSKILKIWKENTAMKHPFGGTHKNAFIFHAQPCLTAHYYPLAIVLCQIPI
jgi:hypothetical protein